MYQEIIILCYKHWCVLANAEISTGQDFNVKQQKSQVKDDKYCKSRVKEKV